MTTHKTTTLTILRGLPGSGKTSLARQMVARGPEWTIRASLDDLSMSTLGVEVHAELPVMQRQTLERLFEIKVRSALEAGISVVLDDHENLAPDRVIYWSKVLNGVDVKIEYRNMFDTYVSSYNQAYDRRYTVGDLSRRTFDRIEGMRKYFDDDGYILPVLPADDIPTLRKHVPNPNLPKAVWLDVDGTAFTMFDEEGNPLRSPFEFNKVYLDRPVPHVLDAVQALQEADYYIVVVSGRSDICRDATYKAFEDAGIIPDEMFMRKEGDYRPDSVIKEEIYHNQIADKYDIRFALDDRNAVVAHLRRMGIPVFQVADGNF